MHAKNCVFFFFITIALICRINADFPDDPKPCKYSDSECIGKVINYFASQKHEGDPAANLTPLDPMDLKKLHVSRGDDSPVHIDLLLTKGKVYGVKTAKVIKTSGFAKEITGKYEVVAQIDYLTILSDYNITGQVLILPIVGSGKSNITLVNPTLTFGWQGSPIEKNGAKYMKIEKFFVDIEPQNILFALDNLFNDKELSDNMNKFLTENWSDIYGEIRSSVGHGLALVARKIVSKFFAKYPYEKYFIE